MLIHQCSLLDNMLPLKRDHRYRQGVFVPKNADKFKGSKAIYRSGLELKFMRFCDNNPNVIQWGSENIIIPYVSPIDGRVHQYYVDNFVSIREGENIKTYLVEIKPYKQTLPPTTKYKKKQHLIYETTTYAVNKAKWEAARQFCNKKNIEFLIITEKELNC